MNSESTLEYSLLAAIILYFGIKIFFLGLLLLAILMYIKAYETSNSLGSLRLSAKYMKSIIALGAREEKWLVSHILP